MPDHTTLETPSGPLHFDRTRIMGIVNITPDSFYDGGCHDSVEAAVAHGLALVAEGADIIDVGGESTRPGSARVGAKEELERVVPVIEKLAASIQVPISVDTYKASVADAALEAGAAMVNDVSALRGDLEMMRVVARRKVPVVLMHSLWPPETMQDDPEYVDVVEDVAWFLEERLRFATTRGISREMVVLDPGIGFGKQLEHNLALLRALPRLLAIGCPLLVGPSRKRFLGQLLDKDADGRMMGTAGAVAVAAASGTHIVRVHDVAAMKDVLRVVDAIVWQV